jgi:hypothetical protein
MLSVSKNWRKRGIGASFQKCSFVSSSCLSRCPCASVDECVSCMIFTASTLVRNSMEAMKENGVEEAGSLS